MTQQFRDRKKYHTATILTLNHGNEDAQVSGLALKKEPLQVAQFNKCLNLTQDQNALPKIYGNLHILQHDLVVLALIYLSTSIMSRYLQAKAGLLSMHCFSYRHVSKKSNLSTHEHW
jgi:hypothetical protein